MEPDPALTGFIREFECSSFGESEDCRRDHKNKSRTHDQWNGEASHRPSNSEEWDTAVNIMPDPLNNKRKTSNFNWQQISDRCAEARELRAGRWNFRVHRIESNGCWTRSKPENSLRMVTEFVIWDL
jgi:hypothetical protein